MKLKLKAIKFITSLSLIVSLTFLTANCKGQSLLPQTDSAIFITSHQAKTIVLMGAAIDKLSAETKLQYGLINTLTIHVNALNQKDLLKDKQIKEQKSKITLMKIGMWVQVGAVLLIISTLN